MIYAFSPGLVDCFPGVDELLTKVKGVACKLDRDIRTRDLRVEARRNNQPGFFKGWAYPLTRAREGQRVTYHQDGLIRMYVGAQCVDEEIVRLYAHELRHIGQFHRGRRQYGTMTIHPMSQEASEHDADDFEERVLVRL